MASTVLGTAYYDRGSLKRKCSDTYSGSHTKCSGLGVRCGCWLSGSSLEVGSEKVRLQLTTRANNPSCLYPSNHPKPSTLELVNSDER